MADDPRRRGLDGDRSPSRPAAPGAAGPAAPLTVDELLARTGAGAGVRRRRAERREAAEATGSTPAVGGPGDDDARPPRWEGRSNGASRPAPASPPVLPTGWQPALPVEPAATGEPRPATWFQPAAPGPHPAPPSRPTPHVRRPGAPETGAQPAPPPTAGVVPVAPPRSSPGPATPRPSGIGPAGPRPAGARPADARPAIAPDAAPRVPAPPERPHTAPPQSPPRGATPPRPADQPELVVPVRPAAPPVPRPASSPLPEVPARPPLPAQPSVPVPGVRRSLPVPPIPGRDTPATPPPAEQPARVQRRAPAGPGRRRLERAGVAVAALLATVLAFYVGLYFYADVSLQRVDALATDGPEVLAPQLQETSRTYLVVGTDLPGRTGPAAVSTLVAHVSGDGGSAVLVSVPPTALTDTPTCRGADGEVREAVTESFATALLDGGPACLVRAVQQVSGLRIDHYLQLDAARLPELVDALDEVSMCLPVPTGDAALALPAGVHELTGEQAAGYLRPGGDGHDVRGDAVAQRQERLLAATMGTAVAGSTLADPMTLTRFLSRAADALTVDGDTTLGDVRTFGTTFADLDADAVERAALPVSRIGYVPAGGDQAAVVVDATATRQLFDAVIDSGQLPTAEEEVPAAEGSAEAGSAPADSLPAPAETDPVPEGTTVSVEPAGVTVDVLDGTGGQRTAEVADGLAAQGFRVAARGVEPAAVDRTVVRYGPASLEPARTVAAAVPGAVLVESDQVGGAVQLVVGPDYTGLAPVALGTPVPTAAAPAPAPEGTADCG
ncbi:LCP family glycopolymer transferase [Modestobacter sp. SYSU DS0875]